MRFNLLHAITVVLALTVSTAAADDLDDIFGTPLNNKWVSAKPAPQSDVPSPSDIRLDDEPPTESIARSTRPTAREILQMRALEATQQRMARLEMYNWTGYHPARPSWNPSPYYTSRYPSRRIVVVPAYHRGF